MHSPATYHRSLAPPPYTWEDTGEFFYLEVLPLKIRGSQREL